MPTSSLVSQAQHEHSWLSPDPRRTVTAKAALDLFIENSVSFLDVRAEAEFTKGTFPKSVNIPILHNSERETVGRTYKQSGRIPAIEAGESIVSGEVAKARVQAWSAWAATQSHAVLFCARGGMRSAITQNWLTQKGIETLRVEYGYKGLRREILKILSEPFSSLVLGGLTGSGKTTFLRKLSSENITLEKNFIDLEKFANHRGSAFGKPIHSPQPSPQSFENTLALEFYRHRNKNISAVPLFEDESKTLGRVRIPNIFYGHLSQGQHVVLEVPFEERVENIYQDYVASPLSRFPEDILQNHLLSAAAAIQEKLGNERYQKISSRICEALNENDKLLHFDWIACLLRDYYDPMYAYATQRKQRQEIFRGPPNSVRDFLLHYYRELQPNA